MPVNPIHTDRTVQHVNVRIYFDQEEDRENLLDQISTALQDSPALAGVRLVSAYELVSDGFGRLVPDDKPLA